MEEITLEIKVISFPVPDLYAVFCDGNAKELLVACDLNNIEGVLCCVPVGAYFVGLRRIVNVATTPEDSKISIDWV